MAATPGLDSPRPDKLLMGKPPYPSPKPRIPGHTYPSPKPRIPGHTTPALNPGSQTRPMTMSFRDDGLCMGNMAVYELYTNMYYKVILSY